MNESSTSASKGVNISITGKYIDFKKEEYEIMRSRIDAINVAMTEKCLLLSLKQLEKNFCFDFVFCGVERYLSKIELYDKKQRKDDLKKWWMNQKASEMAKECLPSILDRMDQMSATIAKQERCELSRNKFEKYIKFELLQCAFKCSFRRPRASSANVFPNTSFQYARSRLRRKLESEYFTESELQEFGLNNAQRRKKKEEWIRAIEIKKKKYKTEYFAYVKKRKQRHKHKHKRTNNTSVSSSSTYSVCSSSDLPIMDANTDTIPPPPPLNNNCNPPSIPPILNMEMPRISSKKPSGYCSQCTSYAIQISKLCQELHSFKVSLGETQMQLNNKIQEANHWKKEYIEAASADNDNNNNNESVDYKEKYIELQSQISLLVGGGKAAQGASAAPEYRATNNSQNSMSFISDPFSVNPGSDKMSVSNADSSVNNRYPSFMQTADSVVSHFPPMHMQPPPVQDQSMRQITKEHLKRNTDSTEKMLEKLKHNRQNKTNSTSHSNPFLNAEVENLLFPIDSNKSDAHNNENNMNQSSSTLNTQPNGNGHNNNNNNNNSMSTFASLTNHHNNNTHHHHHSLQQDRMRHNSNPLPDYNHINNMTLQRVHSSNNNTNKIPTMIPFNNNPNMPPNTDAMHAQMMGNNAQNVHYFNHNNNNNNSNQYYANNIPSFAPPNNANPPFVNVNPTPYTANQTINI